MAAPIRVEVVAEELGASLRWETAATTRATRGSSHYRPSCNSVVPCGVSRPVRLPASGWLPNDRIEALLSWTAFVS
jgi:hypothetical protein